ncbi:MAG: DNA polymerase-3 subunit delta' [Candidatus Endobugula sp.]
MVVLVKFSLLLIKSTLAIVSEQSSIHIPYPWQQQAWQRIQQQIEQNKMPHALLLSGQQGIGKWHFAQSLGNYLLCSSPRADLACGQCRNCQLTLANSHPDKKFLIPEEGAKTIKIDQVRELASFVSKTSQQGGRKVILLGPVEQLNTNSANALLKSLEEPAGDTVLILYTHVLSAVMATIRSRCQLVPMLTPLRPQSREWLANLQIEDGDALLELAGGAPLIARDMVEGDYLEHLQLFVNTLDTLTKSSVSSQQVPDIAIASNCLSLSIQHVTEWWLQIIHRILSESIAKKVTAPPLGNDNKITDCLDRVFNHGQRLNKQWLFKFNDKLLLLRKQQLQGANPNMQLLMEELLLDWQAMVQRS